MDFLGARGRLGAEPNRAEEFNFNLGCGLLPEPARCVGVGLVPARVGVLRCRCRGCAAVRTGGLVSGSLARVVMLAALGAAVGGFHRTGGAEKSGPGGVENQCRRENVNPALHAIRSYAYYR